MTQIRSDIRTPHAAAQIDQIARPEPRAPSASAAQEGPSPFQRVMDGLGKQLNQGEQTMAKITRAQHAGADISQASLLQLQADVYRYNEAVDLSAKLVDRASQAVKTVIQGQ